MLKILLYTLLGILVCNAVLVLTLRWVTPPTTMFMLTAPVKPVHHEWVPWQIISRNAALAVMASEDQQFPDHYGFDFNAIRDAAIYNAHHRRLHGASTITQQTAKNLFLWRGRNYLRKALEAYFTVQIEVLWSKRRTMEIYLNIVQFGPDIYGIEAASLHYFHKHASSLTAREAASLAAVLPDPQHLHPGGNAARIDRIEHQMRGIGLRI